MAIGRSVDHQNINNLATAAGRNAVVLPELLLKAKRLAASFATGWHGRRKRGTGENFWQFRAYVEGEAVTNVDWRRSARDDHLFIRDREWEAAQTLWILPDQTASMFYQSTHALQSKIDRALTLAFVIGELATRAGERIGIPGVMAPSSRNGGEQMALALHNQKKQRRDAGFSQIPHRSHLVFISDFLDDIKVVLHHLETIGKRGIIAHLIEVADPSEELFPYQGHVQFKDPETGLHLDIGRADRLRQKYITLYHARRAEIADYCRLRGWSFITDFTDRPMTPTLLHLHQLLTLSPNSRLGG